MTQSSPDIETRTFDTSGTMLRRVGKVLTITCDSDEIADRVAGQLRTPPSLCSAGTVSEADRQLESFYVGPRMYQREVYGK